MIRSLFVSSMLLLFSSIVATSRNPGRNGDLPIHLRSLAHLRLEDMFVSAGNDGDVVLFFHGKGSWRKVAKSVELELAPFHPKALTGRLGPVFTVFEEGKEWFSVSVHPGGSDTPKADEVKIIPGGGYVISLVTIHTLSSK